jgi:hypothetical protein
LALGALSGVGDASAGQWHEWTGYAYHVRRRLSLQEMALVGEAVDLRGTEEAMRRYHATVEALSEVAVALASKELRT